MGNSVGGRVFTSTAFGSLDAKGRVCIPAPFRLTLEDQETQGLYVFESILDVAVDCFGRELFESVQQTYSGNNAVYDAVTNQDLEDFNIHTQLLQFDNNGRVRLPDTLIEYAGLKDQIAFVGMGRKFQICTVERFKAADSDRRARIRARMEAERAFARQKLTGGVP